MVRPLAEDQFFFATAENDQIRIVVATRVDSRQWSRQRNEIAGLDLNSLVTHVIDRHAIHIREEIPQHY